MSDPLDVLRRPLAAQAPDAAFAAELRERIQRALTEGDPMATQPARAASEGDVAYISLQLDDATRAREFYGTVLGWRFGVDDDLSRSVRVEGQSLPVGIWAGPPSQGVRKPGVLLAHRVHDIAASTAAVRSLGGIASEPHRETYGVVADCVDDQGNGFALVEMPLDAPRPPVNGARPGDVAYITISPGDEARASDFFGSLFGWRFTAGSVPGGRQVSGPIPMVGLWGGAGRQTVTLMFLVDDIAGAVQRVRNAGGTATDPEEQPYGITSDCVDNQGTVFNLGQL